MKLEDIRKIAVIGAGTMGPGIAQVFAQAGYQVTMEDLSHEALERALNTIKSSLNTFMDGGKSPLIRFIIERKRYVIYRKQCPANAFSTASRCSVSIELQPEYLGRKTEG